jgi:Tol biopolymer transport system component
VTLGAGSKLGPYEILGQLGAGGMGEVYRARDPRLGREVAIKVLPPSFSADTDRLRRFEQEARAAGVLNHPNITAVYDIGDHGGAPYVVQELLEGETLRAVLSGGKLSPRRAVDYALQTARGLAAAHERGIVHRDLKPENLFVTKDGRVKILDFGLAKLTQPEGTGSAVTNLPTETRGTEPGVVLGTLGYMSPEQVRGRPADARSDIFSFGAILYEMLSGNRAFRGDSAADTMSAILREDPPDLSVTNQAISPGLERIVRHCLEKNPEQRFHSAHDLAFDLEALSGLSGAAAAIPSRARAPRRGIFLLVIPAALIGAAAAALLVRTLAKPLSPTYQRLTYRKGAVASAFFAPDGQTVVYSAAWEPGPPRIFSTRPGSTESRSLGLPDGEALSISSTGDLAIALGVRDSVGSMTLARVPLAGGTPRLVAERIKFADWSPDGQNFAIVRDVSGRDTLEFPIGKTVYRAESDRYLRFPRISPRGNAIAVVDAASSDIGDLILIDLEGRRRVLASAQIQVSGLVWTADGSELWFSASGGGPNISLYAVSLSGKVRTVRREETDLYLLDISKDGRVLVDSRKLTGELMLRSGDARERDYSWLDGSGLPKLSQDGRTLLFTEFGGGGGKSHAIYLRGIESPSGEAVRLGEGAGLDLSPDGQWVLASPAIGEGFVLIPTGAGQPRPLPVRGIGVTLRAGFFPDGKRIFFKGSASGQPLRLYELSTGGGEPKPISPVGVGEGRIALSPDGTVIAAPGPNGAPFLYPVGEHGGRVLMGAVSGEWPIQWSADGRFLWVSRPGQVPAKVFRIEVPGGGRELWRELAPEDRAGVTEILDVDISRDGTTYVYGVVRSWSTLYLAEGLR